MAPPLNIFSVFTGSGFHDTAVGLALEALGYALRAVGYVERDAAAAALLMARMEHQTLERAPLWCGCISDLDARPLRGFVDLLIASPPCQPYSSAGKRRGNEDERSHGDGDGPLPHLVRAIEECDPAVGWLDNVPEWLADGYFRLFGDELCRLGYEVAPPFFSSSGALGNVHERERVFVLFYKPDLVNAQRMRAGPGEQGEQGEQGEDARLIDGRGFADAGDAVGDADRPHEGRREAPERRPERRDAPAGTGGALADGDGDGRAPERGREQCRQPDAESCGGELADTGHDERHERRETKDGSRLSHRQYRSPNESSSSGGAMGHGKIAQPAGGGLGAGGQSPGRGGQPDGRDRFVAHSEGAGREGSEPAGCARSDGRARKLGDSLRAAGGGYTRREPELHPPGRPIFDDEMAEYAGRDGTTLGALGRRIAGSALALRQWACLAVGGLDPTLTPAVEPGVPVVADALAPSAGDLLRIGGNGVDVLVVAHAFVSLWVEAGLPRGDCGREAVTA